MVAGVCPTIGSIGDVFTGLMSAADAAGRVSALIDRSPAILRTQAPFISCRPPAGARRNRQ
jgi:hypothetical protein